MVYQLADPFEALEATETHRMDERMWCQRSATSACGYGACQPSGTDVVDSEFLVSRIAVTPTDS